MGSLRSLSHGAEPPQGYEALTNQRSLVSTFPPSFGVLARGMFLSLERTQEPTQCIQFHGRSMLQSFAYFQSECAKSCTLLFFAIVEAVENR